MKGDFTRFTFDRRKHYSGIRMQQGRVQLDADWNELDEIHAYRMRTESEDFIGPAGAPRLAAGFGVGVSGDGKSLTVSPGRLYVHGILCENEEEVPLTGQPGQPDLPGYELPADDGLYLAYVEAWHRHVTAVEDPSLREVGLGGPDTGTRLKTVWQVRLHRVGEVGMDATAETELPSWSAEIAPATGRLRARVRGGVSPHLRTGLYRVEVHRVDPAAGKVFVKWSRDNASTVLRWREGSGEVLVVEAPGRAGVPGLTPGQWVELTDDTHELWQRPGTFVRVVRVTGEEVEVDPSSATGSLAISDFPSIPKVVGWDSAGEVEADPGGDLWLPLEDGIEVRLTGGTFRPGDYWLIPARSFHGDVEWPREGTGPLARPPHGIERRHARLALVERERGAFRVREDCRFVFSSLTHLRSLAAYRSAIDAPDGAVYVDDQGNVGLGTREPAERLDVHGMIAADSGRIGSGLEVGGELAAAHLRCRADGRIDGTLGVGGDLHVERGLRCGAPAHLGSSARIAGDLTVGGRVFSGYVLSEAVAGYRVRISTISNATHWVDMPNMGMTLATGHRPVWIVFKAGGVQGTGTGDVHAEFRLLVDGRQHAYCMHQFHHNGWELRDVSLARLLRLSRGVHTIQVQWSVRSPSARGAFSTSFWGWFPTHHPAITAYLTASWYGDTRSLVAVEL
ncbi:MAG: DUF6519 domain-containing protein [Acidobacteriota bacterium]|jgi:hypothetical protein